MDLRRNQAELSPAERAAFVAAVKALKASGVYDTFVDQYRAAFLSGASDPAHVGPAFLPWHREYLRRFERALQAVDPNVCLPYWDWTDETSLTPLLATDFMGGNGSGTHRQVTTGPFAYTTGEWTLTVLDPSEARPFLRRDFGSPNWGFGWEEWWPSLPNRADVNEARSVTTYDSPPWHGFTIPTASFRKRLEFLIDWSVHDWIAGTMESLTSPNDPLFWLHQCNVDRLWGDWQRAYPSASYLPASGTPGVVPGHGLDDPMPPWAAEPQPPTPRLVLDHHTLNYTYDTETLPTGSMALGDDMQPGEVLYPDQSIRSASGRHRFIYQNDGNLVLYDRGNALFAGIGTPIWASATDGTPLGVCIMQADGNFVIYRRDGQAIWSSDTAQHPGSRLVAQNDGNVVIYRPDGTAVWATNTWLPTGPAAEGDDMQPGEVLEPGQSITSPSDRYTLRYQADGNLVLSDGGIPLWASATNGMPLGVCIMQADGNFVIYRRDGQAIWSSDTAQHPGSRLVAQNDGNVVIYRPDGTAVWATNTWLPTGPAAEGDDMQPGEMLDAGRAVISPSGDYTFIYQNDGDLVLYGLGGGALWASGTAGKPVGLCIMQSDGNLAICGRGGVRLWSSGTSRPGSRLVVQDEGNVVIYRPDGRPVWTTDPP